MKNTIMFEVIIIVILIVLICVIPADNRVSFEKASVTYEHVGRMSSAGNNQMSSANVQNNENDTQEEEDSTTKTVVAISRPKGGYAAYEDGTFVEPKPETVEDTDDKTDDNTGGNTEEDADGEKDTTGEGSEGNDEEGPKDESGEDESGEDNSGDFDWDMKDPTQAIDSGKRATLTAPLKLRSTPTISTEDNVIDMLSEGDVLVVTEAQVSSSDPDVPLWVEVYYKGQIGYLSAKYCRVE